MSGERPIHSFTSGAGNLDAASAESLVHFFEDGDGLAPIMGLEIARRLQAVKSTRLAIEFLFADTDQERSDAFDGLGGVCWKAKRKLYLEPDFQNDPVVSFELKQPYNRLHPETLHSATRRFIGVTVLELLGPFQNRHHREVIFAGLTGAFRNLPKSVTSSLVDELRRRWADKRHGVMLSLDFKVGEESDGESIYAKDNFKTPEPYKLSSSLSTPVANIRYLDSQELTAAMLAKRQQWIDAIGESGWVTLFSAIDLYGQGAADAGLQEWKGLLTGEVARRRGVSQEQARADLRKLKAKMTSAGKSPEHARLVEELMTLCTAQRHKKNSIKLPGKAGGSDPEIEY